MERNFNRGRRALPDRSAVMKAAHSQAKEYEPGWRKYTVQGRLEKARRQDREEHIDDTPDPHYGH